MKLYGTTTSPFVRRVRIVAAETGVEVDLVDSATEAGQAALRRVSPLWKVPVAEIEGRVLFDSRVIIDWITTTRGWGAIAPPRDRWAQANVLNAIDTALESAIQVFYLRRDGLDVSTLPFAQRQRDRITAIFEWLAGRVGDDLGLPEISLVCALDWMQFRDVFAELHGGRFDALRAELGRRDTITSTTPHV